MGSSIYNIGITGLMTAQAGLATTGHNISNASTPGFNRQLMVPEHQHPAILRPPAIFGQGTNMTPSSASTTSSSPARC
jgi:flagellar hook-associated protein 1 FlgK